MKVLTGQVVSTKMFSTAVVEVKRQRFHPLYKKIIKRSKKYKVQNDDPNIKAGDMVKIVPTRPISKEKHFKILHELRIMSSSAPDLIGGTRGSIPK